MIRIFDDLEGISQAAAELFVEAADEAIRERGRFSVALSGGNTPGRLHQLLSTSPFREQVDWQNVHFFWGDERSVPPDDPHSNYRMAKETLLDALNIPDKNIHRIHAEISPTEAAKQYETELHTFFGDATPALDLILLGLGDNAHTASLFPHTAVLNEAKRWVADVYVAELGTHRITMTAPLINQANEVIFLISGTDKAPAVQQVLENAYHPHLYPAQLIQPQKARPIWLLDHAAAHKLLAETLEAA